MMDIREVEEYVKYQIANTRVLEYPYPHFFVENVFPEPYYQRMLALWPGMEHFLSIAETGRTGGAYKDRYVISLHTLEERDPAWEARAFWQEFAAWFCGQGFLHFLIRQFQPWIVRNRQLPAQISATADGLMVQDHTNYSIGPHTDAAHRLVSTLFYCPPDASRRHLGTSVYVPRDESIPRAISGHHYPHEHFTRVSTMPFIPNSMFGFVISPNSFHGVEPITEEEVRRNLILHVAKWTPTVAPPAD